MPVWTDYGTGWVKVPGARVDAPGVAFLCCPGPSLAAAPADLRGPGRTVFAINSAYPRIRPDCWLGVDVAACHAESIWYEAFPKVTRWIGSEGDRIRHFPNTFFATCEDGDPRGMFLRRDNDANFLWSRSTLIFALHYILWSGFKRIHLVGCNLGGSTDYHDGRELDPARRAFCRAHYAQQAKQLRLLAPLAARQGITLVSNTADSPINEFLYHEPVEQTLATIDANVPNPSARLIPLEAWRELPK